MRENAISKKVSLVIYVVYGVCLLLLISISACATGNRYSETDVRMRFPEIKNLVVNDLADKTEVVIEGEGAMFYKAFKVPESSRLIVEIPGVTLNPSIGRMVVNRGAVIDILPREIQKGRPSVQFDINLLSSATSNIRTDDKRIIVEVVGLQAREREKTAGPGEMKQLASLKPLAIQADGRESRASVQISEQDLPADYLIGPEDTLEIMVWKNDVLSRTVTVRPDGKISFPLIGDIEAVGLTPIQLRDRIVVRLKEYMESPVVTVIVQQINSYVIYLMGEIVKPGKYQLKSNTTVLQALTLAGGFTQFASRNKIVIFRREYGKTSDTKIKISYDDIIAGGRFENIILKPGDTILVP